MPRILFVQRLEPDPNGGGGNHRVYQIKQDLIEAFGDSEIDSVKVNEVIKKKDKYNISYWIRDIKNRFHFLFQAVLSGFNINSTLQYLFRLLIYTNNPFGLLNLDPYYRYLGTHGKPDICILDHPQLLNIARYNNDKGIVNLYCCHNIETFTNIMHKQEKRKNRIESGLHWSAELEMFHLCRERLMISQIEVNILRGLGFSATYYPYLPVDEIKSRSSQIRQERQAGSHENRFFIMVGSSFYAPTKNGFRWIIRNALENGLPPGVHIIIGGRGGKKLEEEFGSIRGIEFRDEIEQSELNELMKSAIAMLVPHLSGFGSVTRLSEMSCAGLPVITTKFAVEGLAPPPGVYAVNEKWEEWCKAMEHLMNHYEEVTPLDYEAWELSQPKPLKEIVSKYL